jgi:hypothetical protein
MNETTHITAVENTVLLYKIVYQERTVRWFLSLFMLWMTIHPGLLFANGTSSTEPTAVESFSHTEMSAEQAVVEEVRSGEETILSEEDPEIASEEDVADDTVIPEEPAIPPETPSVAETLQSTQVITSGVTDAELASETPPSIADAVVNEPDSTFATGSDSEDVEVDTVPVSMTHENDTTDSGKAQNTVDDDDATDSGTSTTDVAPAAQTANEVTERDPVTDELSVTYQDESSVTQSPTTSSSSMLVTETAEPFHQVTTNDTFFQFSRDECVRVHDGSYYCGVTEEVQSAEDRFYVALDADGDREIFAQRDGEIIQITFNRYDDAAPFYDAVSNSLVWHALVNGRYQIMSYDFATEDTVQLTEGGGNSMEPARYGEVTAWQQWGETSWDIAVAVDGEVTLITNDAVSDIAPVVHDGIVTWKRVYAGGQQIAVYNLQTKEMIEVSDGGLNGTVSNARMMLVFESVQPNGDKIIQGFDPVLNELVPLTAGPVPLPQQLPTSEPTEEIRALVQAKPLVEEETTDRSRTGATASSTKSMTSSSTTNTLDDHSYDLVIPATAPTASTSSSSTAVVESSTSGATTTDDLVIPPLATSSADLMGYDE